MNEKESMASENKALEDFRSAKLQQNLVMRRGTVYRYLGSSLQLLMLGNAGGIGFILGLFRTGTEPESAHWIIIAAITIFLLGCLFSAGTIICVASLALREAHSAERALVDIIYHKISYEEALLNVEQKPPPAAAGAMVFGLASLGCLFLGALIGVVLLIIYF